MAKHKSSSAVFEIGGPVENETTWKFSVRIGWEFEPDKFQEEGGLKVASFDREDSLACYDTSDVAAKLNLKGKEKGNVTGSVVEHSEYLVYISEMTNPKWVANGTFAFPPLRHGGKDSQVKCGYHQMEIKFNIYYNKDKSFDFNGNWNGESFDALGGGRLCSSAGSGTVTFRFATRDQRDEMVIDGNRVAYFSVNGKVGAADIGFGDIPSVALKTPDSETVFPAKQEDRVLKIGKEMRAYWKLQYSSGGQK